jgi:tRNA A-37 threonylcarbamoyl transferase component Bud32/tetratricopeptide (TPR) repeat protein
VSEPKATLEDFEFLRLIGKGGMGTVHEVRNKRTGARYAAKILAAETPRARERFRREAELLARCDQHRGIVKVHALVEARDGRQMLVMDLVDGESLAAVIEREGRLEPRRAGAIALEVARALAFAHERGIVHRDVKPENVLLDREGRPRLGDFGLATARDLERMTLTGQFVGTPLYCAPEQAIRGALEPRPTADVFSAGAVIFAMLAGEPPFPSDSPLGVIQRLAAPEPARDVRLLAPETPPALAAIVARALAKDPRQRYAHGGELARDLERFFAGESTAASARGGTRRVLGLGAIALALAVAAVLIGMRPRSPAPDPETSVALARKALEAGDAAGALAALDALPSPPGSDARVLRARALLLAGRLDEAAAIARDLPPSRVVEAREIEGDVLVARKKYGEALLAYGAVVDRSGEELRIKHGRAAVLAGDDATALADFARLVPDTSILSSDRAANRRLALFAPPLYRRALKARTFAEEERDARVAWRLDAPPPESVTDLDRVWRGEYDRLHRSFFRNPSTDEEVRRAFADCKQLVALRVRLQAIEPRYDDTVDWEVATFVRQWVAGTDWTKFPESPRLADEVVAENPRAPFPLYMAARTREVLVARRVESVSLFVAAGECLPPPRADEPAEIREFLNAVTEHALKLDQELGDASPLDLARVAPLVSRLDTGPGWSRLALARARRGDAAGARADLARAERLAPDDSGVALAHVQIEEDRASAVAWARARYDAAPTAEAFYYVALTLERARRWAEIVKAAGELPDGVRRSVSGDTLHAVAQAHGRLLDFDVAREILRHAPGDSKPTTTWLDRFELDVRADLGRDPLALAAAIEDMRRDGIGMTPGRRRFIVPIALEAAARSWPRGFELVLELTAGMDDPDLLLDRARALAALHRADEARAIATGPLAGRGRAAFEIELALLDADGKKADALALARSEHRRNPDAGTLRELAERLVRAGAGDEVIALVPFPGTTDPRTIDALARALADRRAFEKAFALARALGESDPSRRHLVHTLVRSVADAAKSLASGGKKEEALALVRAFQRPDMPELQREDARVWIPMLFYDLHAYEEVVAYRHAALDEDSALEYARSLYLIGKTEEAGAYAASITGASDRFPLAVRTAFLLADAKRDEAVALVRPERATSRGSTALHLLVDFLVERGENALVVELVDPEKVTDGWVLEQLARSLGALGRKDEARALGRRLLDQSDEDLHSTGARILDRLGP